MCQLKESYCPNDPANINYGDSFRLTLTPAYCNCKYDNCPINPLVKEYKEILDSFNRAWPGHGYPMLL